MKKPLRSYKPSLHDRTRRILALVPELGARSSESEESSSDDEAHIIAVPDFREFSSFSSSPAPSLDSSYERLDLLADDISERVNDDNQVPLSPIILQVFPDLVQSDYEALPSISSVPSLPSVQPCTNLQTPSCTEPLQSTPGSSTIHRKNNVTPASNTRANRKRRSAPIIPTNTKRRRIQKLKLRLKWKKTKFAHCAEIAKNNFKEPIPKDWSPLNYFHNFFPLDLIDEIVVNTNIYSVHKIGRSINVTKEDILDFLAINILMGIVKMPSIKDYWSTSFRYGKLADIMPLKRFQQIKRYIHFADTDGCDITDTYHKITPVLDKIRSRCLSVEEENAFSIDEMVIPYKGKKAGSRRQYNPNKPRKWGFKNIVRAGASGIVYDFMIYAGDDTYRNICFTNEEENLGVGAKMVLALCKSINNRACVVYFDNYFTSLELVYLLRENYGIFSLGTARQNRLQDANQFLTSDKALKKKGRGSSCQVVCNDNKLAIVKWYDNKAVTLVSSYVDAYPMQKIKRYSKQAKSRIDIECPQVVLHYNRHMGGVDLADMLIALYRTGMKSQRWYMNIFSQMIDICINNAWLLRRRHYDQAKKNKKNDRLKSFRYEVFAGLLKENRITKENDFEMVAEKQKIQKPKAERPMNSIRYDKLDHWPQHTAYGRCKFCKRGQASTKCTKCQVHLCYVKARNCFSAYHQSL